MECRQGTFKPRGFTINGYDGPATSPVVGALGGAIVGFTAFPRLAFSDVDRNTENYQQVPNASNCSAIHSFLTNSRNCYKRVS